MALNLYSIDVMICGTFYVKASTPEEALEKARKMSGGGIIVPDDTCNEASEPDFCGREFDDPLLPNISISPAMTIHDPIEANIDCVGVDVPAYEGI